MCAVETRSLHSRAISQWQTVHRYGLREIEPEKGIKSPTIGSGPTSSMSQGVSGVDQLSADGRRASSASDSDETMSSASIFLPFVSFSLSLPTDDEGSSRSPLLSRRRIFRRDFDPPRMVRHDFCARLRSLDMLHAQQSRQGIELSAVLETQSKERTAHVKIFDAVHESMGDEDFVSALSIRQGIRQFSRKTNPNRVSGRIRQPMDLVQYLNCNNPRQY